MSLGVVSGAGSISSNVLDYSKWIKALINSSGPLSKSGHQEIKAGRVIVPADDHSPYTGTSTYALGWETNVYKGHELIQHSGGMEAFGTNLIIFPALKYGIIAFANTAETSNIIEEILMWHLVDEKLGISKDERFDWSKQGRERLREKNKRYDHAVEIFYPSIPNPPLPLSLPLSDYAGTYYHPAFRNVTVELRDGALFTNRTNAAWELHARFEHVSGDYFVAYVDSDKAPGAIFKEAIPAEFTVGIDGATQALGMATEPEMGPEGRIWFERVT